MDSIKKILFFFLVKRIINAIGSNNAGGRVLNVIFS